MHASSYREEAPVGRPEKHAAGAQIAGHNLLRRPADAVIALSRDLHYDGLLLARVAAPLGCSVHAGGPSVSCPMTTGSASRMPRLENSGSCRFFRDERGNASMHCLAASSYATARWTGRPVAVAGDQPRTWTALSTLSTEKTATASPPPVPVA